MFQWVINLFNLLKKLIYHLFKQAHGRTYHFFYETPIQLKPDPPSNDLFHISIDCPEHESDLETIIVIEPQSTEISIKPPPISNIKKPTIITCTTCKGPILDKPLSILIPTTHQCTGCFRLFSLYKTDEAYQQLIRTTLLFPTRSRGLKKRLRLDHERYLTSSCLVKSRLKLAIDRMKDRFVRLSQTESYRGQPAVFPTVSELKGLMRDSGGLCAVTKVRGIWDTKDHAHPLFLTFDHIVPVSRGGGFGIDNIQVMLYSMNQVKGNLDNEELVRWVKAWRNRK